MVFGVTTREASKGTSSWLSAIGIAAPAILGLWEDVSDSFKSKKKEGYGTGEAIAQAIAAASNKTVPEVYAQYNTNGIDSQGMFLTLSQLLDDGKINDASQMNEALAASEAANRSPALTMLLVGAAVLLLGPMLGLFSTKGGRRLRQNFNAYRQGWRRTRGGSWHKPARRPRRPRRSFSRSRR